jgi:hypothetical protein
MFPWFVTFGRLRTSKRFEGLGEIYEKLAETGSPGIVYWHRAL